VKVNISKYLETAQNGGLYTQNNPAVTFSRPRRGAGPTATATSFLTAI
jgi:hypothetical protein